MGKASILCPEILHQPDPDRACWFPFGLARNRVFERWWIFRIPEQLHYRRPQRRLQLRLNPHRPRSSTFTWYHRHLVCRHGRPTRHQSQLVDRSRRCLCSHRRLQTRSGTVRHEGNGTSLDWARVFPRSIGSDRCRDPTSHSPESQHRVSCRGYLFDGEDRRSQGCGGFEGESHWR